MKCFIIGFVWAVVDLLIIGFFYAASERRNEK